jgi:hypothetical protein
MPRRHYLTAAPLLLEQEIGRTEKVLQKPNLDYALGFLSILLTVTIGYSIKGNAASRFCTHTWQ